MATHNQLTAHKLCTTITINFEKNLLIYLPTSRMKKAKQYWELAAMNGNVEARHNLGCMELEVGNYHRAFKHLLIAAKAGYKVSLDNVKQGFMRGIVTKDEYANTLRQYQKSQDETKSEARDKALAYFNDMLDNRDD